MNLRNHRLIALAMVFCLLTEESCLHLPFNTDSSKNHAKEISWTLNKKLEGVKHELQLVLAYK